MEAIITAGVIGPAKAAFTTKLATVSSGMASGFLSFIITESTTGNMLLAIAASAISSGIVAYFTSRPKYIAALSHAKLSEHELLGKQTADLIDKLKNTADENSRIATLQVFARHTIQGYLQAAVSHIELCHVLMQEHQMTAPSYSVPDVQAVLAELDRRVDATKTAKSGN